MISKEEIESLWSYSAIDAEAKKKFISVLKEDPMLLLEKIYDGNTLLHHMSFSDRHKDYLSMIVRKLPKNIDVNQTDTSGRTALDWAIENRDRRLIEALQNRGGRALYKERQEAKRKQEELEVEQGRSKKDKPEMFNFKGFHFINAGLSDNNMRKVLAGISKIIQRFKKYGYEDVVYGDVIVVSDSMRGKVWEDKFKKYRNVDAAGFYYYSTDSIVINADEFLRDVNNGMYVFAHELGHRYWYKFLTVNQRNAWEGDFEERSIKVEKREVEFIEKIFKRSAKEVKLDTFNETITDWTQFDYKKFINFLNKFPKSRRLYTAIAMEKFPGNEKTARRKYAEDLIDNFAVSAVRNIIPLDKYISKKGFAEDIPSALVRRNIDSEIKKMEENPIRDGVYDSSSLNQYLYDMFSAYFKETKLTRLYNYVGETLEDPISSTTYGRSNSREDYAEAFAHVMTNKGMPREVFELFMNIRTAGVAKMDNKKIAKELLKVAKSLIAKDNVFVVKQGNTYTLWSAYSPGSGTTSIFKGGVDGYITDKSGHEYFDSIVRKLEKNFSTNKVIEVPMYDYTDSQKKYDAFGGDMKPFRKMYMVITKDANTVINFFDNKNEARHWAKN